MKRVYANSEWKQTWKLSYPYDLLEVYEEKHRDPGYAYAYKNRMMHILNCINNVTKQGDSILDVGAAQGNFSLRLAEMGYRVTWNDIRADLAEYVEMKREKGTIKYLPGNVFDLKFHKCFDLILATEIIEHVAHPDEFLKNLSKLVKPGGYILITTPLGSYFRHGLPKFTEFADPKIFEAKQFGPNSEDHIFLLHLDEINFLAKKSGLNVVDVKYYTNFLTTGHIKLNRILKVLPEKIVFRIETLTRKLPKKIGKRIHCNFLVLFQRN